MKENDSAIPASKQQKLLWRLLGFAAPYKQQLLFALAIAVLSSVLIPLRPRLIKYGIDNYIVKNDFSGLLYLSAGIVVLIVLHGVMQYMLSIYMQRVGQRILFDIRQRVFNHIYTLPTRYFDTTPVGRLVTRVTNDVEALNELFTSGVVMIISDALVLVWIVVFMITINWKLALVTVMVVPVLLYAAVLFRAKVRTVYGKIRVEIARMNSFLGEYVNGMQTVQLFNRQQAQSRRFDAINQKHTELQIQSITYYAVFFPVVELLSSVAICLVLFYSVGLSGQHEISAGTLIAFVIYAEMFFRPIRDLTEKYNTLQSAVTASERIFEVLDEA
ncbi:MAG: ABC transporter ATP-binding protein, partial [Candidatus Kapabacteria bacterium]|nr:ABC transporter ATP-binding protein [Candidatus Kapabacteria bacterium]